MCRVLIVALCVAVAGCAAKPPTVRVLTADEQVRWQKFCRDYVTGLYVVSYLPGVGEWRFSYADSWHRRVPRSPTNENDPPYTRLRDETQAELVAAKDATSSKVSMSAVIDLQAMRVIGWYYDDGTGVRKYQTCPKPELQESLQRFLHDTQLLKHE